MAQTLYPITAAAGSVTSAQLDPQLVQLASVSLTAANILAMNGTPVTVLAAPGASKALIVHRILFEMTTTATQFASGGVTTFQYSGGAVVHTSSITAATITATAGTSNTLLAPNTAANGIVVPANTAVTVTNSVGAFTTGTGTAVVKIWYSIIPAL